MGMCSVNYFFLLKVVENIEVIIVPGLIALFYCMLGIPAVSRYDYS